MRDPLHWLDVKTKLVLTFIVICLLGFWIAGHVLSGHAQDTLAREINARLEYQSKAFAVALDAHLRMLTHRTEDFASDGHIRRHMELLEDPGGDRQALTEELRRHVVRNKLPLVPAFAGLSLVSRSPQPRSVIAPDGVPAAVVEEVARSAMAVGSGWNSGLIPMPAGTDHGPALVAIATPLRSLDGAREVGRLVSWVRPAVWIAAALDQGGLRNRSENRDILGIVDGDGDLLRVAPMLTRSDGPSADATMLRRGFGVELIRGSAQRTDPDVRSFPIPSATMHARIRGRHDAARHAVAALQGRFLAVGAALAAAVGLLLYFPIRYLAQPLNRMRAAARRLQCGDFTTRVDVPGTDEIGQLGNAFNLMAEAVEERTSRLEDTAADLRERQTELRRQSARLAAVISSMRDGLLVLSPDGGIVLANEAARPLQKVLEGADDAAGYTSCAISAFHADCAQCLAHADAPSNPCLVDVDQRVFEVHTTELAPDEDGRRGRVLVSRDVTERVEREGREIHQERLAVLGEVAAVMAHELNNPLASISMFSQMMAEDADDGTPMAEHVAVIRRNAETCKRAIRELLDYATNAEPEVAVVDVHAVLEDAARFLRPVRERVGASLTMELGATEHDVLGDEVQLRQIFVNLMVNAIQALDGRPGDVSVASRDDGPAIEILVTDTGGGIPEDVQEQVFKPFFTTKARGEGTGLGLPTSRRLAELHGGKLEIARTSGSGTTIRVRLALQRGAQKEMAV